MIGFIKRSFNYLDEFFEDVRTYYPCFWHFPGYPWVIFMDPEFCDATKKDQKDLK